MAEAIASLRGLQGSARKTRLVVDMIRGKKVSEARSILAYSLKGTAPALKKLLESAIANAENAAAERRERINTDDMVITYAVVNEGRTLRRYIPGARGRAMRTRSRSSQVHITLSDAVAKNKKK